MKVNVRAILAAAVVGLVGCAAGPRPETDAVSAVGTPKLTGRAAVPLSDIEPRVALSPGKGLSVGVAPIEAVRLYAKSRALMNDGDRTEAIQLLEKAVKLDPLSFELHVALGRLYLTAGEEFNLKSIEMYEKAAELEPDHLDLQTNLGREYLAKGDSASALSHFRLARLTHAYGSDGPQATVCDFFLATLLRSEGYDSAALEVFQKLRDRLDWAANASRYSPELRQLLSHRDEVDIEIADLLSVTGHTDEAVKSYKSLIAQKPTAIDLRRRFVGLLLKARRADEASTVAEQAVIDFSATPDSIVLLKDATAKSGGGNSAVAALWRIYELHSANRDILYALTDLLHADQRDADAERLLRQTAEADAKSGKSSDFEILRRRFELTASDRPQAARLLITALTVDSSLTLQAGPLWSRLARPTAGGRLRWTDVRDLTVPEAEQPVRSFWVARLAVAAHREDIADANFLSAASPKVGRPFAPAYRELVSRILARSDQSESTRLAEAEKMAVRAGELVGPALAEEIRATILVSSGKPEQAIDAFKRAKAAADKPYAPDLLLGLSDALRKNKNDSEADSVLWGLISDRPTCHEAYLDLFLASLRRDDDQYTNRIVTTLLQHDPAGVTARRIAALQYQRGGRLDAAKIILTRLVDDHPDDPEAIAALGAFYLRARKPSLFLDVLTKAHARNKFNFVVSSSLVEALVEQNRDADAAQIAKEARDAAAGDPDLLYEMSSLYSRVKKRADSEHVLRDVLRIEPDHPGAANDLGYFLTEDGKNLDEAEILIKRAVDAEPRNISYLDSMGWVLYKRGKFAEARTYLDRALGTRQGESALRSDPVMLEHRGDAHYRLGDKKAAELDWKRAADEVAALKESADDELKGVGERSAKKLRQIEVGEEAAVAPTGG